MPEKCSCEGICPVCRIGEVENHKCSRCLTEFCPVCHGTMPKYKAENVLSCICFQDLKNDGYEIMELKDEVLKKIRGACAKEGSVDQAEIENYFGEIYGRRTKAFVGEEVWLLKKEGVIKRKVMGGKKIITLP